MRLHPQRRRRTGADRTPEAGLTPFARHQILRVNDLVPPAVPPAAVRDALTRAGIAIGDRNGAVGSDMRAVVTTTVAGTVVTLEARSAAWRPRGLVLRQLTTLLDAVVLELAEP